VAAVLKLGVYRVPILFTLRVFQSEDREPERRAEVRSGTLTPAHPRRVATPTRRQMRYPMPFEGGE